MCTRPFKPRPRQDPRRIPQRPRHWAFWPRRDIGHFGRDDTLGILAEMRHWTFCLRWDRDETFWVWDETETLQLPRPWRRRTVKTIKHHKYRSMSQMVFLSFSCYILEMEIIACTLACTSSLADAGWQACRNLQAVKNMKWIKRPHY